jgi:hypothetical protein
LERLCPWIGDGVMAVRDVVQAAAGVGGGGDNLYVEDVFSTYLYTGNGSTQTITNGIDLDGEGGLVWIKRRNGGYSHVLYDTDRGVSLSLSSNTTSGNVNQAPDGVSAFEATGFSLNGNSHLDNNTTGTFASWTFRKAPKFFDVVTWSGNDVSGREIAHNLGSTPGCIIVKKTNGAYNWQIYHNAVGATKFLEFNTLQAQTSSAVWNDTAPTDSVFTVGNEYGVNQSGSTYVAYLFAHDAGGFGDDGTESIIKCGSWNGTSGASSPIVNLGWEPQWILVKRFTGGNGEWLLFDNMRGMPVGGIDKTIRVEVSTAEESAADFLSPTATGFIVDPTLNQYINESGSYIYIAIRRGPMKTPESGTEVFHPFIRSGNDSQTTITGAGFAPDLWVVKTRNLGADFPFFDRLRGVTKRLASNNTNAEETFSGDNGLISLNMDGITIGAGPADGGICNDTGANYGNWLFKRAPGFFDVVAYSGDSASSRNIAHNLSASPELIMLATRTTTNLWPTYHKDLPDPNPTYPSFLRLNTNGGINSSGGYYAATPTESVFTIGDDLNASGQSYIAYLFASLPGVSKVGSYTGNGTSQTIDCGFSNGARFVLIKATSTTGDWLVWDTARGINAGDDPRLALNSTAAEVADTDSVDATSSGFIVNNDGNFTNASDVTYIYLAIA